MSVQWTTTPTTNTTPQQDSHVDDTAGGKGAVVGTVVTWQGSSSSDVAAVECGRVGDSGDVAVMQLRHSTYFILYSTSSSCSIIYSKNRS